MAAFTASVSSPGTTSSPMMKVGVPVTPRDSASLWTSLICWLAAFSSTASALTPCSPASLSMAASSSPSAAISAV